MGRLGLSVEGFECQATMHLDLRFWSLWSHGSALHRAVTSSDWTFRKITPEVRQRWDGGRCEKLVTGLDPCYRHLRPLEAFFLLVLLGYLADNR